MNTNTTKLEKANLGFIKANLKLSNMIRHLLSFDGMSGTFEFLFTNGLGSSMMVVETLVAVQKDLVKSPAHHVADLLDLAAPNWRKADFIALTDE